MKYAISEKKTLKKCIEINLVIYEFSIFILNHTTAYK